jgi:hypothetical protein
MDFLFRSSGSPSQTSHFMGHDENCALNYRKSALQAGITTQAQHAPNTRPNGLEVRLVSSVMTGMEN